MRRIFFTISIVSLMGLALGGCKDRSSGTTDTKEVRKFPTLSIPEMMTDNAERARFYVENYWNAYGDTSISWRCDSVCFAGVDGDKLEDAFATFTGVIGMVAGDYPASLILDTKGGMWQQNHVTDGNPKHISEILDSGINGLVKAMEKWSVKAGNSFVFNKLDSLAEKYFYNPNSPARNEELYLRYLRRVLASDFLPENLRPGYAFDASMCELNRPGTPVADFRLTDISGRTRDFHALCKDLTLLIFSNPGCPDCKVTMQRLVEDQVLTELVNRKKMAVVNMHIDDDIDVWKSFAHNYPPAWWNGYDKEYIIRTDRTYNVRAIPSLYLINKDMKVVLKDATPDSVLGLIHEWAGQ